MLKKIMQTENYYSLLKENSKRTKINLFALLRSLLRVFLFFYIFPYLFQKYLVLLSDVPKSNVIKFLGVFITLIVSNFVVNIFERIIVFFLPQKEFSDDEKARIKRISRYWYFLFIIIFLSISWHFFRLFSNTPIDDFQSLFAFFLGLPTFMLASLFGYYTEFAYFGIVCIIFINYLHLFLVFMNDVFGSDKLKIGAKKLIFFSFGVFIATGLAFSPVYDINRYEWLSINNNPLDSTSNLGQADIVYFSFVNLTNLGYGYITPMNSGMLVCTLQNLLGLFVTGVFLASSINFIGKQSNNGS